MAIFELMAHHERTDGERGVLCLVAADVLQLSGAAIGLVPEGQRLTSFCSNMHVAQSLMDLEITLGEGPCTDAAALDEVVEEGDLRSSLNPRWTTYVPSALELGARAVFAFPLHIGVIRMGALSCFRDEPGELTVAQSTDGHLMASVIARSLLALQAGAPYGVLSQSLQREAMFDFSLHQAAGMVAVQGAMTTSDALIVLRARAFAIDSQLADVAVSVITRRMRYEPTDQSWQAIRR